MYINLSLFLQSLSKCAVKKYEKKKQQKQQTFHGMLPLPQEFKATFPHQFYIYFFLFRFFVAMSPFLHPYIQTGWFIVLLWRRKCSLLFFTFLLKQKAAYLSSKHVPLKYRKTLCNAKRPYDWTLHIANLYLAFN